MACGRTSFLVLSFLRPFHCTDASCSTLLENVLPDAGEPSSSSLVPDNDAMNLLQKVANLKMASQTFEQHSPGASNYAPDSNGIMFIHIPKNGGTAIEEAGLAHGLVWGDPDAEKIVMGGQGEDCSKRHVPPHLHPADFSSLSETFCVIRDPYSRILSEYRYLRGQDWGHWFLSVKGYIQGHDEACSAGLNRFAQEILRTYPIKRFMNDCHVIPQSEYIWGPDGHRWCDKILRFEELGESFNSLMKKHSSPVRLTSHANVAEECPELTASDFTPETLSLIQSVYKDDFSKLNYTLIPSKAPVLLEYTFSAA